MLCPNCGEPLQEGASFCGQCGKAIDKTQVSEDTQPQEPITPQSPPEPQPQEPIVTPISIEPISQGTTQGAGNQPKKQNTTLYILAGVIVVLVALIIGMLGGFFSFAGSSQPVTTPVVPTEEAVVPASPDEADTPDEALVAVSSYEAVKSDVTWSIASRQAESFGGKLISINSASEFAQACALAEEAGIKVFWAGAQRSSNCDWEETTWLDSTPITYTKWLPGEPTYISEEGELEDCLLVFKVKDNWYFNDAPNDVSSYYANKIGYIIEYTEYVPAE